MEKNYKAILKRLIVTGILSIITLLFPFFLNGQTIRYQQSIRGGFTFATNSLTLNSSTIINNDGQTKTSSYSDLILPAGSTIVKAFLYAEGYVLSSSNKITSVKFKVPGGSYTTLTSTSTGFIANVISSSNSYTQFIIDVTGIMPANGYVTTLTAGGSATNTGRYYVADISPFDNSNRGYGWALVVVYTNPNSKYRNVTIADVCKQINGLGTAGSNTFTISNLTVPSSGTVSAVVGFTGSWGNEPNGSDNTDYLKLNGTALTDSTTNTSNDILNCTIGFCGLNNVSVDGGPAIKGSYKGRNPYNTYGSSGSSSSYYYDADIFNANGIISPSATPVTATLVQGKTSSSGDAFGSGTLVFSIDIVAASLTKSVSPISIAPGGTATYTWTITNTTAEAINLTNIGFTDNLPSAICVQNPSGVVITGGTGGTVTATPGGTSVTLSGLSLGIGQTATVSVNVTNVIGQTNTSCASNPAAFTNGFSNITSTTPNLVNLVTSQCLVVDGAVLPVSLVSFTAIPLNHNTVCLNWETATEKNNQFFEVERSNDGIDFNPIYKTPGNINSTISNRYSFTDKNPYLGQSSYYRLKQIDYNGSYAYSPIRAVDISQIALGIITHRIANGELSVTFYSNSSDKLHVVLIDLMGKPVLQNNFLIDTQDSYELKLDVSNLPTGIYILNVQSEKNMPSSIRIIKNE